MILVLISLIAMTAIAVWGKLNARRFSDFGAFVCGMFSVIGFVGLFVYCFIVMSWVSSGYQKDILNREYGTNYTQAEIFYASGVINTVRELQRKRVELNGDLITGE